MRGLTEIQRRVVIALRSGPLDHFAVAADLVEAPFRVRGELKALKRERLVREVIGEDRHVWELTDRGATLARHEAQIGLGV